MCAVCGNPTHDLGGVGPDDVVRRQSLPIPGILGADRVNERLPVDLSPVASPQDLDISNVMPSLYPVRRSMYPIALVSQNEQYEEWSDDNNALKHEFSAIGSGGNDHPGIPPNNYGTWISYDEYRLAIGIAPRGSFAA